MYVCSVLARHGSSHHTQDGAFDAHPTPGPVPGPAPVPGPRPGPAPLINARDRDDLSADGDGARSDRADADDSLSESSVICRADRPAWDRPGAELSDDDSDDDVLGAGTGAGAEAAMIYRHIGDAAGVGVGQGQGRRRGRERYRGADPAEGLLKQAMMGLSDIPHMDDADSDGGTDV